MAAAIGHLLFTFIEVIIFPLRECVIYIISTSHNGCIGPIGFVVIQNKRHCSVIQQFE